MDLVYKIGSGCEWENYEELRYSLRSVEANYPLHGQIFIVGTLPNWIDPNFVYHIPALDPYLGNKDANLINKLILACMHEELSSNFINMSDDMFFLSKVYDDFFETPLFNNGLVIPKQGALGEVVYTKWEQRLLRTKDQLVQNGLTYDYYEAHIPYALNKSLYVETMFKYPYGFDIGLCGNTLYFNTLKEVGKHIEPGTLARIETWMGTYDEVKNYCESKRLFNYTTKALNEPIKLYLKTKFPNKSIYEL